MGTLCSRICLIDLRLHEAISTFRGPFALACVATVMCGNDGFSGHLPKLFTRLSALLIVLAACASCVFTCTILHPHCNGAPLIALTGIHVHDFTYIMIKGSCEISSVTASSNASKYQSGSRVVDGTFIVLSILIFLLPLTIQLRPFKIIKSFPSIEMPGMYKMRNFLKFLF